MSRPEITSVREVSIDEALVGMRNKMPPVLYKYRPWSSDYQKSSLFAPEIYFSAPSQLNDPFDIKQVYTWDEQEIFHPVFMEKLRKQFPSMTKLIPGSRDYEVALSNHFENVIKPDPKRWFEQNQKALRQGPIYDRLGLFCTTTNPLDDLMWAHYGDNYKGICIGYDPIEIYLAKPCEFGKVHYISVPLKFSFVIENHEMERFVDNFVKKKKWEYEDEYRYLTFIEKNQDRSVILKKSAIKEIYIGNRMDGVSEREIVECLKSAYISTVKLFRVVEGNNSSLVSEEIFY